MSLKDNVVAAPPTIVGDRLDRWRAGFEDMFALVAGQFAQVESRRRARLYLLGLLSGAERKNSWTIAEQAGDLTPDGMQRLLNFYSWDDDAIRDLLRGYVLDHLEDPGGVVAADETGFLKKGDQIRRCATSVFRHGRADRELPARGLLGLRLPPRPGIDRPRTLSADVVDH
jgi:hypothetical protein